MGPEDWETQEPPADFADRVMERIAREDGRSVRPPEGRQLDTDPPRRARVTRLVTAGGLALAASAALVLAWRGSLAPSHGEAIAADRRQVALGERAVAVLEPEAHVTWSGDDVTQPAGDVFYRVEPGSAFRVHTPAGDVQVLGTCFRVRVERAASERNAEDDVNGRDVKAGAIGAALGAAALVTVYEGKVAVSRASQTVTLTAGESARADSSGVHRDGDRAADGALANGTSGDDPLVAANANLADSVREYKQRLEAIEAQKKAVEKQLGEAQQKLATSENDGQVPVARNDYDLSQDDWKQLAEKGEVRAQLPCPQPEQWDYKPDALTKLGLAPQDAQPIHDALKQSSDRVWATIRPLCVQALQGNAATADLLGPETCQSLVFDSAQRAKENTDEEMRQVAEIRAGVLPQKTLDSMGPAGKMLYSLSGETKAMEKDLGQSIGPDDARRFLYSGEGCWHHSAWASGPRPKLP